MIKKINLRELLIYIIGMVVLGIGLSLSTKLSLGTSALMALPFSISKIYNISIGNVTLIYYIVFIIIQIVLHIIMKKYTDIIGDILQLLVSFVLTRFLNILDKLIPTFTDLNNVLGTIYFRLFFFLIAMTCIGVGIAMVVKTIYPPNPTNGFIRTTAEFSKKDVGLIKNVLDISLVCITIIFSYLASKKVIGIGIGTILAMLGVGRIVFYFNRLYGTKIEKYIKRSNK